MAACLESPAVCTDSVLFHDTSSDNDRPWTSLLTESFDEEQIAQQFQALQLQERVTSSLTQPAKVVLLDLPPEILTNILLHLPFTAVLNCQSVNRYLRVLISESVELQYYVHLNVFGQLDNPHCDLPVSERLNQLLSRERRWEELEFDFDKTTEVPVVAPYEGLGLSGEALSLSYADGVSWRVKIPRETDQEIKWKCSEVCAGQTLTKMRVREHNLLFLITLQPRTVYTNATESHILYEVHINRSPTGELSPSTQRIILLETKGEFEEPWATMDYIGDNLVLVMRDLTRRYKPDDQVYVYDWKTGELKLKFSAPFDSYWYPLFLTTQILLLPNMRTGELEYWNLQTRHDLSEPTSNQPFFILSLPRLSPDKAFDGIYCYCMPDLNSRSRDALKPFDADPHHAIVVFNPEIKSADTGDSTHDAVFFVHRSSLVQYPSIFSASISSNERPRPVPYDDWGPSACRWFMDSIHGYEIVADSTVFGQRYIPSPTSTPAPIVLLNFNQIDVARALSAEQHALKVEGWDEGSQDSDRQHAGYEHITGELLAGVGGDATESKGTLHLDDGEALETSPILLMDISPFDSRFPAKTVVRSRDPLEDPDHCFENTVYSSLPYIMHSSQDKYMFDHVLLTEESVLGLQTEGGSWDRIKKIHFLHYG